MKRNVLAGLLAVALSACGGEPPVEEEAIGSTTQATETFEVKCWRASLYDLDSDGYADRFAHKNWRVTFYRPSELSMTCPTGYVMARGDCDDSDPNIHPRQHEVYGNGVDDNCDGRVDEPTIDYRYNGFGNTSDGFTMRVRVHDAAVVAAHASPATRLYYEVEYQKLSRTATTHTTGKQPVGTLSNMGSHRRLEIALDGLSATTVYRARVRFFSRPRLMLATTTKKVSLYTPVGATSDWYYTTTTGTGQVSLARTEIVLRGLYEYYLSNQLGYTGYMGRTYVDGTRYGADEDEWWCSEFYSWAADKAITIGHKSSVSTVKTYFNGHSALYDVNATNFHLYMLNFTRGDYLALDTNGSGDPNHSAMVLDYDADQDVVWTLEGNTSGFTDIGDSYDNRRAGNETMVRTRSRAEVDFWGAIRSSMLD
jgi:hypothetical protein